VAGYNANINITVSGQDRLNYVLNSVEKINAIVSKLKPINILTPGAGAGGDAIRVAKKQLDDFARLIVNFKPEGIQKRAKELSTTLAGSAEQADALATALANVGLKSGGFKQQAAEVRNYALALDAARRNTARLNSISQTVQRQARVQNIASRFGVSAEQVEQRINNIREIRYRKDRQAEVEAIRASQRAEDFELRLARIREKNRVKERQETARRNRNLGISDAIIGGAFPLLFGQGVGASLGGALGGGIGARVGGGKGGFGGSLVGTLAGQATIDFAVNSSVELGQALRKPTENIQQLTKFLGIAGTELDANVTVLQKLGLESTASAVALAKLEDILKAEGYRNLDTLSKQLIELENAFNRLKLAAANLLAEPLTDLFNFFTDTLKLISRAGGVGGFITTSPEKLQAIDRQIQSERKTGTTQRQQPGPAELEAQKAVSAEKQRQISLATAQKSLEADTLSLTRVDLATRRGAVALQQVQNELARKQLEYKNETTKAAKDLLGLEVQVLEQQRQQAVAAQRNAQIEAQRQVQRQLGSLLIEQTELENEIFTLRTQSARLLQGEAVGLASALNAIEARRTNELGILYVRRDLERLGINEAEVLQEINTKYDGLASAVQHRYNIEKITLEQQQAQYNLTQLQIQQQRELTKIQASRQAELQIQQLQAFADPVGIGFFGGALINEKLALAEYNVTLQNYNEQLLALEDRMAVPGLNPDVLLGLQQEAEALKDIVAVYAEYQPAIIQARLEQEKFNAVFNAVSPLVDNVFNSFTQLIQGTMSAKEAFASFLNAVADMLLDTAKQMIASYIAIGIARMFAGIGGGGAGGGDFAPSGPLAAVGNVNTDVGSFFTGFAEGGFVTGPTRAMVGEGGEPEYIIPASKMSAAMKRYGGGARGSAVIPTSGDTSDASGNATPINGAIDVRYTVERINSVDYVTADQFQQGMQQAAMQGAQRGEQMVLRKLQQSPSTRRRVGVS
jgi:hypothetical protein